MEINSVKNILNDNSKIIWEEGELNKLNKNKEKIKVVTDEDIKDEVNTDEGGELKEEVKEDIIDQEETSSESIERNANTDQEEISSEDVVKVKKVVKKKSNPKWYEDIPENNRPTIGDVFYLYPNKKFGKFVGYGKREGLYYLSMYKKNSFDFMSKDWTVKSELLIPVEIKGQIVNSKFEKIEKCYILKEEL